LTDENLLEWKKVARDREVRQWTQLFAKNKLELPEKWIDKSGADKESWVHEAFFRKKELREKLRAVRDAVEFEGGGDGQGGRGAAAHTVHSSGNEEDKAGDDGDAEEDEEEDEEEEEEEEDEDADEAVPGRGKRRKRAVMVVGDSPSSGKEEEEEEGEADGSYMGSDDNEEEDGVHTSNGPRRHRPIEDTGDAGETKVEETEEGRQFWQLLQQLPDGTGEHGLAEMFKSGEFEYAWQRHCERHWAKSRKEYRGTVNKESKEDKCPPEARTEEEQVAFIDARLRERLRNARETYGETRLKGFTAAKVDIVSLLAAVSSGLETHDDIEENAARFTLMLLKPFHLDVRLRDDDAARQVAASLLTTSVVGDARTGDEVKINGEWSSIAATSDDGYCVPSVLRELELRQGKEMFAASSCEQPEKWFDWSITAQNAWINEECRDEEEQSRLLKQHAVGYEQLRRDRPDMFSHGEHAVFRRHPTYRAALAAWTLADRRLTDPRWYPVVDGEPRHPLLENLWRGVEGKDRATRMKADRRANEQEHRAKEIALLSTDERTILEAYREQAVDVSAVDPSLGMHMGYDTHHQNKTEAVTRIRLRSYRELCGSASRSPASSDAPHGVGAAIGGSGAQRGPLSDADLRTLQGAALLDGGSGGDEERPSAADADAQFKHIAAVLAQGTAPPPPGPASRRSGSGAASATNMPWSLPLPSQQLPAASIMTQHVVAPSMQPQFDALLRNGGLVPWAARVGPSPIEWSLLKSMDPEQSLLVYKRWSRCQVKHPDAGVPPWVARLPRAEQQQTKDALVKPLLIFGKPGAGKSYCHVMYVGYLSRLGHGDRHQGAAFCGAAASRIGGVTLSSAYSLAFAETKKPGSRAAGKASQPTPAPQGTPSPEKQAFYARRFEQTIDELWACGLPLIMQCNDAANRILSAHNTFMGGLLLTGMGDPYQKQWAGAELYGPELADSVRIATATAAGGGKSETRGEVGRAMIRAAFENVTFLDGQHRANDLLQRHVNTRCRHGSADKSLYQTVLHRNLLSRATTVEKDRFRGAPVVSTRHGLLEGVTRTHPQDYCRRNGIRAVVWNQPDEIVKVAGNKCRPTPAFRWMRELIHDHPSMLPQNNTGKIAAQFCYIPESAAPAGVEPYQYSLCTTGGGTTGSIGITGAVTHAAITLVGIEFDERDRIDSDKNIDEDGCWRLKWVPLCLYARLVNPQMQGMTIRDDLPTGVIIIMPQKRAWKDPLNLSRVCPQFWAIHGDTMNDMHMNYSLSRFGFMIRPGESTVNGPLRSYCIGPSPL